MSPPTPPGDLDSSRAHAGRVAALDGLRGLASLNVFFAHAVFAFLPWMLADVYPAAQAVFPAPGPGGAWLQFAPTIFYNGHFAICIFFALSGFVLSGGPSDQRQRNVLVARAFGRYPRLMLPCLVSGMLAVALLSMGAMAAIQDVAARTGSTWLGQRYTQQPDLFDALRQGVWAALWSGEDSYNPPFWTMRPELWGSWLLFGHLMIFRSGRARLIALAPVLVVLAWATDPMMGMLGGCLLIGGLLVPLLARARPGVGVGLVMVGLLLGSYNSGPHLGWLREAWDPVARLAGAGRFAKELANVFGAVAMVGGAMAVPRLNAALASRPLAWLGKHTFAIYLLHFPIICSVGCWSYQLAPSVWGTTGAALAAIGISMGVTVLMMLPFTRWIDRPAIDAARKLSVLMASILAR